MERKKVLAANWKMYKSPSEAVQFFKAFLPQVTPTSSKQIYFFPSAISLWVTQEILRKTDIKFGAQNCYSENEGAFTGENSPLVVKELGAHALLVGHSERRQLFAEDNALVAKKVKKAQEHQLVPIICVGETLEEREQDQTESVLKSQLETVLKTIDKDQDWIIAYEPVWAIGTGKVATPEQANHAHILIRKFVAEKLGQATAQNLSILYGGSVKPENAKELTQESDIDGFLVGGASLKVDSFVSLFETL